MIHQTMGLGFNPKEPIADDKLKGGDSAIDAIENVFKMEGGVTRSREGNLFPVEHIKMETETINGGYNGSEEKMTIEKLQEEAEVDPDKDISDEEVSEDKKVDSNEEDHLNEEEFDEDYEEESSSIDYEDNELTQFISDMSSNKINFMGGGAVEPKPSLYVIDHYPFILKQ